MRVLLCWHQNGDRRNFAIKSVLVQEDSTVVRLNNMEPVAYVTMVGQLSASCRQRACHGPHVRLAIFPRKSPRTGPGVPRKHLKPISTQDLRLLVVKWVLSRIAPRFTRVRGTAKEGPGTAPETRWDEKTARLSNSQWMWCSSSQSSSSWHNDPGISFMNKTVAQ